MTITKKIYLLCFIILSGGFSADLTYVSPRPNAKHVSPHTAIILRTDTGDLSSETVTVSVHNAHQEIKGQTLRASDDQTTIFKPFEPFRPGARISVDVNTVHNKAFNFQFTVAEKEFDSLLEDNPPLDAHSLQKPTTNSYPRIMPNGVSVPSDFPHVNVYTHKPDKTAAGFLFVHNIRTKGPYNIIFDNDGSPVWYERWGNDDNRRDFSIQDNGEITMHTRIDGNKYVAYDQNFNLIGEYAPDGGYNNDGHELQVLANGNYLIIGRRDVLVDASQYVHGGLKNARVQETTVQEFTPNHQMIFNWPALEHLTDGIPYLEIDDPLAKSFRFPHFNAIDVDVDDGNLLISSRMLSEVTKVDRQSGDIIWRLGGEHSDFTFVNDPFNGFSTQHDIRSLGNGLYSVFDNGNYHEPQQSRGVVYKLDTEAGTATLVWQYTIPSPHNFSYYMGSMQHLPNGNYLINWAVGELPKASEVTPAGELVYEMNFAQNYDTYRTFRYPWSGVVKKPRLFVEQDDVNVILIFNKFGDKNVDYYNIYGGTQTRPTTLLDTCRTTLKRFSDLPDKARYYFRVTAVDENGRESEPSDVKNIFVNYLKPGENIIKNGGFGQNENYWELAVTDADAHTDITPADELAIYINDAGVDYDCVQLLQESIPLVQGRSYRLEFDARASQNKIIEPLLEQPFYPWNNYGKINPIAVRRSSEHFSFDFMMEDLSDFSTQLAFNCGAMPGDVFIDNVSLMIIDNNTLLDDLPAQWQHQDIGEPAQSGGAGLNSGRYVVNGSGSDINGTSDQFHFAYQQLTGDAEFSARVVSISKTHVSAKAGIMIRNSLAPGSAYALVAGTVTKGLTFQTRIYENQSTTSTTLSEIDVPRWIKIVRKGQLVISYESDNGSTWNLVGSATVPMNETAYVGFAVTSHDNNVLCSGQFDDVHIRAVTPVVENIANQPGTFTVSPAFPNPFNPKTTIRYNLPSTCTVNFEVFNLLGERVEDKKFKRQKSGAHSIQFDASLLNSGLYFYKLSARAINGKVFRAMDKITVVK